ncbi:HEPN domain-containing protein [Effusibacillus pohliae]|uniref:HEPN domain-containing protein n=1 Tax=Effusibacillus pohliae TaxID=232270 RepID=UPI0003646E39|nr:HEPN domain-containing protein [Effusibacillus pohliae]
MSYTKKAVEVMLKKAKEKYESAEDDFLKGRYDSCVSNLYYSAYQTVTAYMISSGVSTSKHTHVRAYVNKEMANKGLISKQAAKLYNMLMDARSDADYDIETFNEKQAKEMLEGVRLFNREVVRVMMETKKGTDSDQK